MSNTLESLRRRIDSVDARLLRLLNERGRLVQSVGAVKARTRQAIYSPERERALLARLKALNRGPLSDESLESVFMEIVHASRRMQKPLTIAYFGPEATFTHMAAMRQFGKKAPMIPCSRISDVFAEVERGGADYGVVPVENSTEGVVNHTLDMFLDSPLQICTELVMPIHHALLGRRSARPLPKAVRTLYTFAQPYAQCRQWVETHLPGVKVVQAASTAQSAQLAARHSGTAAIGSEWAAEYYKLDVLASRIEDSPNNVTRFLVVGTVQPAPTGRDKTSVLISIKDRVGALQDLLMVFKRARLNLSKIESRPSRQRAWEYVFFVDVLAHQSAPAMRRALDRIRETAVFVKVLGSYPRSE